MTAFEVIDQVPSDYWDTGASHHPIQWWYHASRFRAVREQLRSMPQGSAVLDIACGSGYALAQVVHARPDLRVTGIDVSAKHIAYAARVRPTFTFLEAAAEALPCPDKAFAAVTCMDTLEHVVDPGRVLAEAYRVLQPGGRLIVQLAFEEHPLFKRIWRWWVAGHGNVWKRSHLRSYTPHGLRTDVMAAGFVTGPVHLMHLGMSGIVVGVKPHA